ncbi:OLC1v1034234C1 [Oldenlandia corymbosa var. corymbosa]|uniref:OLC1v1034234C1 n=1 Tax=Oldenlandia corymbosa var. corymbosa TaxID=529605 RepID=A0AAV1CT98_OLDCO|nr:OLC1v1034234C1 [Oldenlandia corymbosa var. corymbosa]
MAAEYKLSLKLLIDTASNRVLFAEAGKDAVDVLFHMLTLPMGTVIRLLSKQQMVGSLGNLYESIENLRERYIQPNQSKDSLLKPRAPINATFSNPLLSLPPEDLESSGFVGYRCNSGHMYFCDDPHGVCPQCRNPMSYKMTYVAPPPLSKLQNGAEDLEGSGGFVKGLVTYMVMDDLVVKPMSTISSIALLHKLNVKDIDALEEREVDLGINEALNLLKASLASKEVLTTVFLGNSPADHLFDYDVALYSPTHDLKRPRPSSPEH